MRISLPDVAANGPAYDALQPSIRGFRSASLVALYDMTDQHAPGATISSGGINDSSGNGNHAAYQTGSVVTQTAQGQHFASPGGGGIITPVPIAPAFSIFTVVRQTSGDGTAGHRYPAYALPSSALAANVSTSAAGNYNGFYLGADLWSPFSDLIDLGIFTADPANFPGGQRMALQRDLISPQAWVYLAVSVNPTTDTIHFVSSAGDFTIVSAAAVNSAQGALGYHAFGVFPVEDATAISGDLGLAAIHDVALSAKALRSEAENARRIVRARGAMVV